MLSDSIDVIIDTGGIDTIRSSLDVKLQVGIENAELVGFADTVAIGNSANNLLVGNMGNNILDGLGGVDTLTGGAGDDQFIVAYNGLGLEADTITDFVGGKDLLVIDLLSFGFDVVGLGLDSSGSVSAESFIKGAGAKPLDPNDHYLVDTATGQISFDPDGTGPLSSIVLANLSGITASSVTPNDLFIAV